MTTRTIKEHAVRQIETGDRLVWKTEASPKIRFYASAENTMRGVAELHAAASEAFALKGNDHVWVVDMQGTVRDAVSFGSAQQVAA